MNTNFLQTFLKENINNNRGVMFIDEKSKDFNQLPTEIRNELIDLSGLSKEEAIEKMKEVFEDLGIKENMQNKSMTYWDEAIEFPKNIDRKEEVNNLKRLLPKKKTPAYVEQFGVNKNNRNRKK